MQSDSNIEFHNEINGDQFRVILWRNDLKCSEETTLKSSEETTLETENSKKTTLKSSEETTLKTSKEKTTQKIINLMTKNPDISIEQLASLCSLTRDGINWQIRKLKESGKIRRVGPDKGGHWEICE